MTGVGTIRSGIGSALLFCATLAYAGGPPVGIVDESLVLHKHADIMEDPTRSLTWDEISQAPSSENFEPGGSLLPDIGGTKSGYWLRVHPELPAAVPKEEWLLYSMQTELDRICVYWPLIGGTAQQDCAGLDLRRDGETSWNRDYIMRVPANLDTSQPWYVYAHSDTWLAIPLELMTLETYMARDHRYQYLWGMYYGSYAALVIFSVFAFIALRDTVWLFFGLHYAALGLLFFVLQGRPMDFVFPGNLIMATAGGPFFAAGFVGVGCLFYRRYLDTMSTMPRWDLLLKIIAIGSGITAIVALFAPMLAYEWLGLFGLAFACSVLIVSFLRRRAGYQPATYALVTLGLMLIFGGIKSIELIGIELLPPEPSLNLFRFCSLTGALVILLGMADGVRRLQAERDREARENELRREELEHSNAELREFYFVASHDLKQPMRGISGFAELLKKTYRGKLDAQADEYIDYISQGAQRVNSMIAGFLELSGTHSQKLNLTDINTADLVNSVLQDLNLLIEETHTQIEVDDELPTVTADAEQLARVFRSLIHNSLSQAADHNPIKIHISASQDNLFWTFSVKDTGPGIAPNRLRRIFNLFAHDHETPEEDQQGTGVGLTICRRLIKQHGGRIWAQNVDGGGAEFLFTLPKSLDTEEEQLAH